MEGSDGRLRNNHIHDNFIRSPIEVLKISGAEDNTFTASSIIFRSSVGETKGGTIGSSDNFSRRVEGGGMIDSMDKTLQRGKL